MTASPIVTDDVRRGPYPFVYFVLYLPFGMTAGYFAVTLEYQLKHAGVTTAQIGALLAFGLSPHVFKFLWAPVVDTTFTAKGWYAAAVMVVGLSVAATGLMPLGPSTLPILGPLALVLNIAVTFVGMAAEILMAHGTTTRQKGQAGGWSQAGNVGGAGLGGGAGLWMASHLPALWMASCVLGAVIVLCALILLVLPPPSRAHRRPDLLGSVLSVVREVWSIARSRVGALALMLFILPLGTGTAANLLSSIAGDWRAGADRVALVSGVAGGVMATVGAVAGGFICDRMDRKSAYALFAVIQALCALAMAAAPRTPAMFTVFALAYAATNGLAYAAFSALTLETIGKGAAATKYNVLAGSSNFPILYVAAIEGWVQTRWGSGAMLTAEAALAVCGLIIFGAVALATRPATVR